MQHEHIHYKDQLYFPDSWQLVKLLQPFGFLLPTLRQFVHKEKKTLHNWTQRRHRLQRREKRLFPLTSRTILFGFANVPGDFVFLGWKQSYGCVQAVLLIIGSVLLVISGLSSVILVSLQSRIFKWYVIDVFGVIGPAFYVIANYVFFLNVINTPAHVHEMSSESEIQPPFVWIAFHPHRLDYFASVFGILATTLLTIGSSLALVSILAAWPVTATTSVISSVPGMLGSSLLFISFYLQWVENQHYLFKWSPRHMTWWQLTSLMLAGVSLIIGNGLSFGAYSSIGIQYATNIFFFIAFCFLLIGSLLFWLEVINP